MLLNDSLSQMPVIAQESAAIKVRRSWFIPLIALFIIVGSLVSVLNFVFMGITLPLATFLATILALVPLAILNWYYANLDSGEPESRQMLWLGFLWGALGATGFAIVANTLSSVTLGTVWGIVLAAPFTEEILKGSFIIIIFIWRRHHLDGVLEGIVYAGFIGMGFAFVENITYFTASYSGKNIFDEEIITGGAGPLLATFFVRFLSLFAHPLFTSMTGIGIGYAVMSKSKKVKFLAPLAGLLFAIILHGLWNGIAVVGVGVIMLLGYAAFIIFFVCYMLFANRHKRKSAMELQISLLDLSRLGALPHSEISWLLDRPRRRKALNFSKKYGGTNAAEFMRRYQDYSLKLGFLHHKVLTGAAPEGALDTGVKFFNEIKMCRPHISFPPQPGAPAAYIYGQDIDPTYWQEAQKFHPAPKHRAGEPSTPPLEDPKPKLFSFKKFPSPNSFR